jgi:hypothetical protein
MAVDWVKGNITNPQTLMSYIYVLNNPTKYIDPFGLLNEDPHTFLSKYDWSKIDSKTKEGITYYSTADIFDVLYGTKQSNYYNDKTKVATLA